MIASMRRLLPLTQHYYHAIIKQCSTANVAKEMKEILRLAVTGDLEAAIRRHESFRESNDIPDWGVVKLSSILLANGREQQSEKLLKQHYEETGGQHRFARKSVIQEEQVLAALSRVMSSADDDGVEKARRLYRWLLDFKFCSNKDVYIVLFIQKALQRNGIAGAIAELEQLKQLGRVKSLMRTFHLLLYKAMEHGTTEELSQVEAVISSHSPSALVRLKGFVLLQTGKKAAFVESLGLDPRLEHGQLQFMLELAAKLKAVEVLESLIELSLVLKIRPQQKAMIYDELVKIYGKREDAVNLERITEFVLKETDKQCFTATLGRLAHFYRCSHLEPPSQLVRTL